MITNFKLTLSSVSTDCIIRFMRSNRTGKEIITENNQRRVLDEANSTMDIKVTKLLIEAMAPTDIFMSKPLIISLYQFTFTRDQIFCISEGEKKISNFFLLSCFSQLIIIDLSVFTAFAYFGQETGYHGCEFLNDSAP